MKSKVLLLLSRIILILAVVGFTLPLVVLLSTSFKLPLEYFEYPPKLVPASPTLRNYMVTLGLRTTESGGTMSIVRYIINSIGVASLTVILCLTTGTVAAYSFARFHFPFRMSLLFATLAIRMVPRISIAVPLFLLFRTLNITNTWLAVALAHSTFTLPFAVWMLQGFFQDIPREVEESAEIDGASRLGVIVRIFLPLAAPGMAATGIFASILSWNEFVYALVLTSTGRAQTVPVAISLYIMERGIYWGELMSAACLATIPVVIFGLSVQRFLATGLSAGAVKG